MTASSVAITLSNAFESALSPTAPMPSDVSVTPSCIAVMNCGGSLVIFRTARARLLPWWGRSVVRGGRAGGEGASGGEGGVLARNEKAVEQHEQPDADQLESECHAPDPGA